MAAKARARVYLDHGAPDAPGPVCCALWVPDAVAWCYGAGGDWRRRIEPVVEAVTDLCATERRRPRST